MAENGFAATNHAAIGGGSQSPTTSAEEGSDDPKLSHGSTKSLKVALSTKFLSKGMPVTFKVGGTAEDMRDDTFSFLSVKETGCCIAYVIVVDIVVMCTHNAWNESRWKHGCPLVDVGCEIHRG